MERYARPYSAASSNPASSKPGTPSAADRHLLSRRRGRPTLAGPPCLGHLSKITPRPHHGARYPKGDLGDSLLETAEPIRAGQIHTSDGVDEDVHRSSVVDLGTGVASRHQHATGGGGGQHLLTR